MAVLLSAALAAPQRASAHATGISQADFVVDGGGVVRGSFVFAASELSPTQAKDLRSLVVEGVAVTGDGRACAASFEGSQRVELDGVVASVTYRCAPDARDIEAVLYYLNDLQPGHRTAASMTAGTKTAQKLLTGDRRLIGIELDPSPANGHARAPKLSKTKQTVLLGATVVWFAFMVGLFVWRFVARAKTRKKPGTHA